MRDLIMWWDGDPPKAEQKPTDAEACESLTVHKPYCRPPSLIHDGTETRTFDITFGDRSLDGHGAADFQLVQPRPNNLENPISSHLGLDIRLEPLIRPS